MSHQYDPAEVADEISDLRDGDRVELVWQSRQSHTAVDATGVVRDDPEYDLRVETDDRTLVAHVEQLLDDADSVMLSSVYDDARTTLGDLVDVRVRERGEESLRADPLTDPRTTADLDPDAESIVLVGCGDAKADEPRPARELYTSNYFSLKRQYAEEYGDEWAILSAEHGLLDPDVEIEPYDTTIDDVDRGEWEIEVLKALSEAVPDTEVVLLVGPDYDLEGDLTMYGADVETPTADMRIGDRMSWLSDELEDDEDEDEESDPTTVDGVDMSYRARKKKDSWRTPPEVYEPISDAVDGIDLDPCAGPDGDVLELPDDAEPADDLGPTRIADRNVGPVEDGLSVRWEGDVFVNPPFSEIDEWLATAVGAWRSGDVDRVFFVSAANTGTVSWWHRWIVANASVTYFPGPRQNYIDPETDEISSGVSFNSAISVFGDPPDELLEHWRSEGDLVVRPQNLVDADVATDGGGETPAPTEEPPAPDSAPKYLREGLGKQDPDTLREIAAYADRLAEYKQAEAERELEERSADVDEDDVPDEWDADEWEETLDSTSAPSGATLTVKTIDDRDYYYYQWREGGSIKSEYVAPVDPAGND